MKAFALLSLLVLGASAASIDVRQTTPVISSEPSCQKIFTVCYGEIGGPFEAKAWSSKACVLAATCFGGKVPVNGLLAVAYNSTPGQVLAVGQARLAPGVLSSGPEVTEQNFIDAWYGLLSTVGGPFPASVDSVKSSYSRIASWTGFCGGSIPNFNVADYFQFSPTVQGSGCGPA